MPCSTSDLRDRQEPRNLNPLGHRSIPRASSAQILLGSTSSGGPLIIHRRH
ncbi:hypothetical protein BDZ89DRAFT_1059639 [Hymenopellis radicata]|nr:hypothetical protein BDZ89DRAFT_1059639 [Hymenopellis radicata]